MRARKQKDTSKIMMHEIEKTILRGWKLAFWNAKLSTEKGS